ncbi:MAG: GNAT family N-acetyltransferase [Myxococcota bacterium]
MKVRLIEDLAEIEAATWDTLAGPDDPFSTHAFLQTLEASGSVGPGTGWFPVHVTVWDEGPDGEDALIGALPLYAKEHSYGEYIFDWAWADAAMRVGTRYYPKLVAMAPFTPATGSRLLVHPAEEKRRADVIGAMLVGAFEVAQQIEASSMHFLYVTKEERDALLAHPDLMPRLSMQYHWQNREGAPYESFDDYLGAFRSSERKKVRKERRRVGEAGIEVRLLEGAEITPGIWRFLDRVYRNTASRKWGSPYLTREFFELGPERLKDVALAAIAFRDGEPVAGTLNFERGKHVYGRYWGCLEAHDMLHFELCYYQLIERAIARGATRFEAGAQGQHKIKRGLLPARIHSVHWVRHPVLRDAVQDFLPREARAMEMEMEELAKSGPFKREG